MLEGTWVQNVGIPRVSIEVHGDHVTIEDLAKVTYDVVAAAPCELVLRRKGAVDKQQPAMPFAVRRGKVVLANGALGQRAGGEAVVCTYDGVYTIDASDACMKWTYTTTWTPTPAGCRSQHADFGDELFVDGPEPLITTDDVLHSRFDYPNLGIRVHDLALAEQLVTAAATDDGMLRAARTLGGIDGDTSTLPGLVVTAAAAPKRWNGKQVTLHATFYGGDFSDSSAAFWSHLVPDMDDLLPMVTCGLLEPTGVAPGDRVTVTGTIEIAPGSRLPSLTDCTIEKAP